MTYIEQLQKAYFDGTPLISNEEYDSLTRYLSEESIGAAGDVKHMWRMWSLDKKYPCRGDELPENLADYVETLKLDGCAVSNLYFNGNLVLSLTRGDGIQGTDITDKMRLLVPNTLKNAPAGYMQVTGEVATTADVENRRNFASGAMNQKEVEAFAQRRIEGGLVFVAYGVTIEHVEGEMSTTYTGNMSELASLGFITVLNIPDHMEIPDDGIVYRLNDNKAYEEAGVTAKFPKGAFAVKEDEEGVWTTLQHIEWSVGKSGKVVPTAIFDEVIIDDARITRATLNNPGYIQALGLTHIGQKISVIRAGGIIPKIIEAK